jgi:dienelactone hydrolase
LVCKVLIILAYGEAASFCLEHYIQPAANKLCALIAYYPSIIPDTQNTRFPPAIRVLVHLAGSTIGVRRTQQLLGVQGKRRIVNKRIAPGIGTGSTLKIAYPTYTYDDAEPGFAEHDLDEYEKISAELAWTRSLEALRRAFRRDVDLEKVWEDNVQSEPP